MDNIPFMKPYLGNNARTCPKSTGNNPVFVHLTGAPQTWTLDPHWSFDGDWPGQAARASWDFSLVWLECGVWAPWGLGTGHCEATSITWCPVCSEQALIRLSQQEWWISWLISWHIVSAFSGILLMLSPSISSFLLRVSSCNRIIIQTLSLCWSWLGICTILGCCGTSSGYS